MHDLHNMQIEYNVFVNASVHERNRLQVFGHVQYVIEHAICNQTPQRHKLRTSYPAVNLLVSKAHYKACMVYLPCKAQYDLLTFAFNEFIVTHVLCCWFGSYCYYSRI